jgi:uncharacterized protein (DUF433 family)
MDQPDPPAHCDKPGRFRLHPKRGWHAAYCIGPVCESLLPGWDVTYPVGASFSGLEPKRDLWHINFMNARISINPKVCHGQACIAGTRIPVHQIVRMFAHGDSIDRLLAAYPPITREDVLACLDYAASLAEEQVTPLDEAALAG